MSTPTDPAPSAAEVKELIAFCLLHHTTLTEQGMLDIKSLIERGELDRERLNWLENGGAISRDNFGKPHVGNSGMLQWKSGNNLREAIDAARAPTGPNASTTE